MTYITLKHSVLSVIISVVAIKGIGCGEQSKQVNSKKIQTASLEDGPLIRPGDGYGKIELGMDRKVVRNFLGEPDQIVSQTAWQYQEGFAVLFDNSDKVAAIMCGAWCEKDSSLLQVFRGHTNSGIKLGASKKAVVEAYGEPQEKRIVSREMDFEVLRYTQQGIQFAFRNDGLVHVTIRKYH